jgi:hypothetical protein
MGTPNNACGSRAKVFRSLWRNSETVRSENLSSSPVSEEGVGEGDTLGDRETGGLGERDVPAAVGAELAQEVAVTATETASTRARPVRVAVVLARRPLTIVPSSGPSNVRALSCERQRHGLALRFGESARTPC